MAKRVNNQETYSRYPLVENRTQVEIMAYAHSAARSVSRAVDEGI